MEAAGAHPETASRLSCKKGEKVLLWREDQQYLQRKKKNHHREHPDEDIKYTKEDDIAFPVTPLVSQVNLQNLYTTAKNRKR